jgi:SPP1 family phage portal protein
MVEYWNNSEETGDFEDVISQIDAYNTLQSDRINDREQFADALLVLWGVRDIAPPADPEDTRSPGQRLREDKTLALPDEKAGANYLTKQLSEADIEVLKNAIKADIHKFSLVPDLTDEKFAGNSSGVAMKYKLLGLEQLTKIKERWFREGLRSRLRLFAYFLSMKGKGTIDPESVAMTFKRSLPVNELEISQMVGNLTGLVPDEILLAQVPFVQDPEAAIESLKKQKDEDVKRQQQSFGGYPDANQQEKPEEKPVVTDGK